MNLNTFQSQLFQFARSSKVSLLAAALAMVSFPSVGRSDPPFSNFLKRGGGAANAQVDRELKTEHGPWLIFAMSFEGDNAKAKATTLAEEIHKNLGIPAYVMPKKFDYSERVFGNGIDESGKQKVMKYRDSRVIESAAVLVGEFNSAEDERLKAQLDKIKSFKPASLSANDGTKNEDSVSVKEYRNFLRGLKKDEKKEKPNGPMANAFVTRNPLLPEDFFRAPDVEKFVFDLNRDPGYNEFNLMECKGKYTVRVATFRGEDQFISWGRNNSNNKQQNPEELSQLEKAAQTAYLVTRALRNAGIEAYQFHDRTQSIVTVGSFDELGKADANNRFAYSPEIQAIVKRFGLTGRVEKTSTYGAVQQPTTLFDIVDQRKIPELYQGTRKEQLDYFSKLSVAFDIKPTPMTVPRYHASRVYAGSLLGTGRK